MKKSVVIHFTIFMLFLAVNSQACMVSDDILWVQIKSTSWEIEGPQINYNDFDNQTIFTFTGIGTFNNPFSDDFEVTHSDGCEWKAIVKYSPDQNIQDPLEGTNNFPFACTEALVQIDYPPGKTNFNIAGGISFPGKLVTLPLGFYEFMVEIPYLMDSEISSINYMILSSGEVQMMRQDSFCGPAPSTSKASDDTLNAELAVFIFPTLIGVMTALFFRKLRVN
jgi:hypothetical protein